MSFPCYIIFLLYSCIRSVHLSGLPLIRKLQSINWKTEFPNFLLTLTISKIFLRLFPDLETFSFFPDFSLTMATLFLVSNLAISSFNTY